MNGFQECYVMAGVLWSLFALQQQRIFHSGAPIWKNVVCVILNALLWPVCIVLGMLKARIHIANLVEERNGDD